ncbi:aspartate-semialdehyde dehydrogenase [Wenzhouxiangella sp. XN24]|uniref:aspartate-semialdehyde dehydrogenase n=1 Tax=Wenzhouxiangella sp. XN24 TaxID=2713569 RepID=UPI0013ED749D|nr:aspartate-semialdehyde dehydrogenase [Wenzhouxiangella sp. XN24]NGX16950.1 aspartate-semialdehyde dehydrogenase [Wenzhouxiangella sp. XN24]
MSRTKSYSVAVVGATGLVGEAMLECLAQREFPIRQLHLLASERSAGTAVTFAGRKHVVTDLAEFDFSGVDLALFSAGGSVSAEHAPRAAAAGAMVIDNTSHFRYDDDVPLVVPEVNPEALERASRRNIIANPNCSTIQMVVALKPIHDAARITRINVATYQSVSGAGRRMVEELARQTANLMNGRPLGDMLSPRPLAFNALPQIDAFEDNGYTREEMKMVWETQKIFADPTIGVNATAVRVPVFFGHSEAVHIETERKVTAVQARRLLREAPGVKVMDRRVPGGYPTAATEATGADAVWVGRIREDISHPRGLSLWVVSDNIRKGAALNSVQIAETFVKTYL